VVQAVEKRVIDRAVAQQHVRAIAYRVCIYALLSVLALVGIAFAIERARLKSELKAEKAVASSALEAAGFQRAKIVSQRALLKKIDSGLQPVVKAAGLHVAAIEKARATLKTKVVGKPQIVLTDEIAEPIKIKIQCIPIPWTDRRLTLEAYNPETNAIIYSLDQQYKLVGTYLADERGTIKFGKLELWEIDSRQNTVDSTQEKIIGKAEITDYELLASKPPSSKWRPEFGVKAGCELDFNGDLKGVLAGVEIGLNKLGIFGLVDIKEQPTLLVGAGWRW